METFLTNSIVFFLITLVISCIFFILFIELSKLKYINKSIVAFFIETNFVIMLISFIIELVFIIVYSVNYGINLII